MELASPITIYWDLPPDGDVSLLRRVAADIADCRPLMVQLASTEPRLADGLRAVLEQFRDRPVSVTLTIPLAAYDDPCRELLQRSGVRELLLEVDRADRLGGEGWPGSGPFGISFPVTTGNWRDLPDLLLRCAEGGTTRLVLPMQRLYGDEVPFFLTAREQRELADALDAAGGTSGLSLTIHDPFLWRAFNPGVPFPQGGCQAANTMIAIAPDGGVYPCPTLPVRLGTVGEGSLKEIIASAAKKEFRQKLLEHPDACRGCAEVTVCKGGCRGRAYVMHQSLEGEDPACW